MGWGQPVRPPPPTVLTDLGLLDSVIHAFASDLQGVVSARVSVSVTYPAPSAPVGKFATIFLLQFRFTCGVVVDGYLPPIWEAVA